MDINLPDTEFHLDVEDLDDDESDGEEFLPGSSLPRGPRRPAAQRYQQEFSVNFLLPYSDKIEAESTAWLEEIKEGLAKSVLTGDYRPGLIIWSTRLEQYLRLFGRKFTKEEHIHLVQLYFDLITDEQMEVSIVSRMCQVLCDLLRKMELLSPNDLQLPWRKLYLTYERLQFSRDEWHGLINVPDGLANNLTMVVNCCRCHFAREATQEMLDTWRPLLCPHAPSMKKAIRYFSHFLPTTMLPGHDSWRLWFDEFMGLWLSFASVTAWESDMISLFSRLALDNIGVIDWTPYISFIFTKFLRNLRLPVGKKRVKLVGENRSFDVASAAIWPVAMLHNDACLTALGDLFKAVEPYFYPSNFGDWSVKLSGMLMKLPQCVVGRLNMERFKKPSWIPAVPVEAHLTDDRVRSFVLAMKPLLLLNMYSKHVQLRLETLFALKSLAELAPDLIVPELLERLYPALDSLTEPHRLTASMSAVTISLRSLFQIEQGRTHVLPLLMAVLPGIDSNDYKKSTCTFSFLTCLVSMVSLGDCSQLSDRADLSEEERMLCLTSSGFEEFALLCIERCLMYITNSTNDLHGRHDSVSRDINERMTREEKFTRLGMSSLVATLIYQSSDKICQTVLQRLFHFVSSRYLSYSHYTGAAVASFCAMAMRLRPAVAQSEIFEPIMKLLKDRVTVAEAELATNEEIDEEIAWTVKLTAEIMGSSGRAILGSCRSSFVQCLHILLSTKCSTLYKLSVFLFKSCLRGLLTTFPTNTKSVSPEELGIPVDEFVSVRHWCQSISHRQLRVDWHQPDDEEIDFAEELIRVFLEPALDKLKLHQNGSQPLERKELERLLLLVEMFVSGAAICFPFDSDPSHQMPPCETAVKLYSNSPDPLISASVREIQIAGKPARQYLFDLIQPVLRKISAADEDDVKSIKIILRIFRSLMFYRGLENEELQGRIKAHIVSGKQLGQNLGFRHEQLRLLMFERVTIQHLRRHYDHRGSPLTTLRSAILMEMIKLATGPYKDIRVLGQNYFQDGMSNIRFAYRAFVDEILNILETSQGHTELLPQMKGSLYLILGGKAGSLVLKHDWHTLSNCFPAVVRTASDSKTVSAVFDRLAQKLDQHFSTTLIHIHRSEAACAVAQLLLADSKSAVDNGEVLPAVTEKEEELATLNAVWNKRADENGNNERLYLALVNHLLDFVQERVSTKPKNFHFALFVLSFLIRRDMPLLPSVANVFMDNWTNTGSEKARKLSQHPLLSVMRYLKRPIIRTTLHGLDKNVPTNELGIPKAGIRTDNLWLCFVEEQLPQNEENYESTVFVDKFHHGYYGWPASLEIAAPTKDQVGMGNMPQSLTPVEKVIYDKMTEETYVETLIRLLSVEDSKQHGKFDSLTYWIFRTMFRHFEDAFLPVFLPHLTKLVGSKDEHAHRCAAEILSGIVRGSKRWPYKKLLHLWDVITPVLRTALGNLSSECLADWGEFAHFALNEGDSRRRYPLLKLFFDLPKSDTSFQSSSRLYVLQSAFFVTFDWRRKELHTRILDLMKEHIEERYRDRVAWTLANLFRNEIRIPNINLDMQQTPLLTDFLTEYYGKCKGLLLSPDQLTNLVQSEPAMPVFKTLAKIISQSSISSLGYSPPQLQWFLPFLLRFESDSRDDELRQDCLTALACLSQIALSSPGIEEMLQQVEGVVHETTGTVPWRDKVLALQHLQTVVFNNFFTIKINADWVLRIQKLAFQNLENESLEVRETACVTLAGLVQCGFVSLEKGFLDQFFRKSTTKYRTTEEKAGKALLTRHAGILGLCAYITAFPYSIAAHTPDVLVVLSGHVNDPQPINQTVQNTIKEFRRTHLDNWSEHKVKFTEEQLAVLTDLLVSPTYYA